MNRAKSVAAFERAKNVIPGGVNSPVRAFRGVGGTPVFIDSASGCTLRDLDGNDYIDYVMSWGPMILGHAYPAIVEAVREAALRGTSYGTPTEAESELAELVIDMVPSIEKVRFVSSGTEATMSALRLARGFTGRAKLIKFAGCYHGHGDSFLISAGSGALTNGVPDSPGVTEGVSRDTIVVEYNDLEAVRAAFAANPKQVAAIIVEPYVGNMGLVLPKPGFLQGLRDLATAAGALLIFDEVMTGFRLALGGAQEVYGIRPDMTALGKVIGGGLPIAAYGGRRDVMSFVAPSGPIYQAGTLSGNPMAVSAGLAMLRYLRAHPEVYSVLEKRAALLATAAPAGITTNRVGSMMTWFFNDQPVTDYETAKQTATNRFRTFFNLMLERGIYLPPSQFEAMFISAAHSEADIERTISAARECFALC